MLIRDLPEDERPREKLLKKSPRALSDAEILALFLATGKKGVSAVDLGREILKHFGSLRNLSRATAEELTKVPGIGPAKAAQLAAIFEIGQRLAQENFKDLPIGSPDDVYDLVGLEMQRLSQESVRAILLNPNTRLIHITEVFLGTGHESFANPPEILRKAIGHAASSLILVHNHPSGDPTPSRADHEVTRRMKSACDAVGLEFTDHIVIGSSQDSSKEPFFSFREAGLL